MLFTQLVDIPFLSTVDSQATIVGSLPGVVHTQLVVQVAHKVDLELLTQGFLKPSLSLVVGSKVEAVINVGSKDKGSTAGTLSFEHTWIMM